MKMLLFRSGWVVLQYFNYYSLLLILLHCGYRNAKVTLSCDNHFLSEGPPTVPVSCQPGCPDGSTRYLFIIADEHTGSTAIENLIASSPNVANLCSAGTFACEGTDILVNAGVLRKEDRWKAIPSWPKALELFERYWEPSDACIKMDKSPYNLVKIIDIATELRAVGKEPSFLFLTRSPCFQSTRHRLGKFAPKMDRMERMKMMRKGYEYVIANNYSVTHIHYEDFYWRGFEYLKRKLLSYMPCLGSLDESRPFTEVRMKPENKRARAVRDFVESTPLRQTRDSLLLRPAHVDTLAFFGHIRPNDTS